MKTKLLFLAGLLAISSEMFAEDNPLQAIKAGWNTPARTCKPHTRWPWPGNVLTDTDIIWQLEQMASQGLKGVEITSAWGM